MSSNRPIRFYFRDRIQEVSDAPITRSTLDWLREDMACTGTKEGCNEGDCGACTVIVAELARPVEATAPTLQTAALTPVAGLQLRSLNACLAFLPSLDGKALLTVEDLQRLNGGAQHPVQQAMVACHGSQCGFCTPGFVMSLACLYEQHGARGDRPTRQGVADALSGNLCRCTGYRPILDAGEQMFSLPPVRLDTAPIVAALQTLAQDEPLHYQADNPAVASLTGADTAANAAAPRRQDRFMAPRSVAEFARRRLDHPQARILAGATDIGLWVNKQFRDVGDLLYIGQVAELRAIGVQGDCLHIGAAATLEEAWAALAAHVPEVAEVWRRFASLPTRHAGTLGGNIANGSPIGDGAPALLALGARLMLRRGDVERELALEDFYLGYMVNALAPGEFLARMIVPLAQVLPQARQQAQQPAPSNASPVTQHVRIWKVSRRHDCDISAVCAGFMLRLNGDRIAQARIAFGGMAATVSRARGAEHALIGQAWNEATLAAATAALAQDYQPLTDLRATAARRVELAAGLLRRLWLETRPSDAHHTPLPTHATSVWAARRTEHTV